jgi:hypothetical protein
MGNSNDKKGKERQIELFWKNCYRNEKNKDKIIMLLLCFHMNHSVQILFKSVIWIE